MKTAKASSGIRTANARGHENECAASKNGRRAAPRPVGLGAMRVPLSVFLFLLLASATRGQVAPTFQGPAAYGGIIGTQPISVAMGDFNGDGLIDFAVAEVDPLVPSAGQVELFIGQSDGSFISREVVHIGTIPFTLGATNHILVAGNFNGPGQPAGVAVVASASPDCPNGGSGVVVMNGDGTGTFDPPICIATTTVPTSVAVADFNGDTFDDLAVSNPSGSAFTMSVFLNNGNSSSNGFAFQGSYSSQPINNNFNTLYGTLVRANLGPSCIDGLLLLANVGFFTQYIDAFCPIVATTGLPHQTISTFATATTVASTGSLHLTDIVSPAINGVSTGTVVGVGLEGLYSIAVTFPLVEGVPVPNAAFGSITTLSGPSAGTELATGDFDGNGVPDFAVLGPNLEVTLNPFSGAAQVMQLGEVGTSGQAVAAGFSPGLNQWVVVDAGVYQYETALLSEISEARSITAYLMNSRTGNPEVAAFTQLYGSPPDHQPAFAVADFNGDGLPDVAVLGQDQANFAATVSFFANNTFTSGQLLNFQHENSIDLGTSNVTGNAPNGDAIVAGHFRNTLDNPSGLADVAILSSQGGIALLENQGSFSFVLDTNCGGTSSTPNCYVGANTDFPGVASTTGAFRPPMIATDVNGDGVDDIVVAIPENCSSFDSGGVRSAIFVFISNGDGTFQPGQYYPSPVANPVSIAAGKLLGSGSADLVVANGGEACSTALATPSPSNGVAILPNKHDGTGAFGNPEILVTQAVPTPLPWVSSVAVADMNGDGVADIVLSTNQGIDVYLNSPANQGSFTNLNSGGAVPFYGPTTVATDIIQSAAQIDIADFNLDGFPDVGAVVGGIAYVFPNDGTGNMLVPAQGYATGAGSGQIKAIDINGDGSPDFLVSNPAGFAELLNETTFQAANPLAQYNDISLQYGGITLGSLNTMPIVLANTGGAPLLLTAAAFANNSAGEFSFSSQFATQCLDANFNPINSTLPLSIPGGGNCTFYIVFTPNAVGPQTAQLLFFDNASTSNASNAAGTGAGAFVQTIGLSGGGIAGQANTTISVTNSPTAVAVGTLVTYTVTLTNPGPSPTTTVVFSHQLEPSVSLSAFPANCTALHAGLTTSLSCSVGTIAASSSFSFSFSITPTVATTLTNPFAFTQDEPDNNPESTTDNITVLTSLTLTIPAIMETITVRDAPVFSDISITENITVTDSFPSSTTTLALVGTSGSAADESATLSATVAAVTPASGIPSGMVAFFDAASPTPATPIGTRALNSSGVAPFTGLVLAAGTHSFTASYLGSTAFAPSTSAPPVPLTVTVAPPRIGSGLGSLILDPTANAQQYVATVSISNGGNLSTSVQVTGATLNGVSSTSVPVSVTLGPAGTASVTLNFPSTAGAPGARAALAVQGTYSALEPNGTTVNGSWTGSFRSTLPASSP